jgi:hypothetical protein
MIFRQLFIGAKLIALFQRYYGIMMSMYILNVL